MDAAADCGRMRRVNCPAELESGVARQFAHICERLRHIARLHRQHVLHRGAPQLLFEQLNHVHQLFRMMVTDVVDLSRSMSRGWIVCRDTVDKVSHNVADVVEKA